MRSCSFDISDHTIKYGELKPAPGGLALGRYGQVKMGPGIVTSGKIEDLGKLIVVLKDLKDKLNLHFVRVSLPEEQMYLFTVSVPRTSGGGSLRETILFQLEEHIPIKASETIFDFNILSENKDTTTVEVAAIAVSTIESYVDVFKKAGLVPISFELEAQAIARSVIEHSDRSPVMVVDFGEARTGVSIAHNNRVLFTTTLDIGGNSLTEMIAKNFKLSFEEAEKLKHDYGNGAPNGKSADEILPIIINGISVLRDELNKHYTYWKTHNDDGNEHEAIDRIILCGGGANLPGVPQYLESSMKVKVMNANVWVNILDINKSIPEMSHHMSLDYATVLGLALGDFDYESRLTINVLPQPEKKRLVLEYWARFANVLMVLLISFSLFATVLLMPSYYLSSLKEGIANDQLNHMKNIAPKVAGVDMKGIEADINSKLSLLSGVGSNYKVGDKIFRDLVAPLPKGVTVSQAIYNEGTDSSRTLSLGGIAVNRAALSDYKKMFDNNPSIDSVDLPTSDFLEKSNLSFTVSLKLK
ncbi:MAG: pilus assembly protein PilM [bacterium]